MNAVSQDKMENTIERRIEADGSVREVTYKKVRKLGQGGFAVCYEVKEGSNVYALKIYNRKNPRVGQQSRNQVKILQDIDHPNVIKCYKAFNDFNNSYLLLELCQNGSLQQYVRFRKHITEPQTRYLLQSMANILQHFQAKGIVHRDIKLANFLLDQKMHLKIADFGLAIYIDQYKNNKNSCGTPNYLSPQALNKKSPIFPMDVWSVGITLYALLFGRPPFQRKTVQQTYSCIRKNIISFPQIPQISSQAKQLIQMALDPDPQNRPTPSQILKHPFLTRYRIPQSLSPQFIRSPPNANFLHTYENPQRGPDTNDTQRSCSQQFSSLKKIEQQSYSHTASIENIVSPLDLDTKLSPFIQKQPLPTGNRIVKWLYDSSYGLAYVLDSGSIGMLFNDHSKIIRINSKYLCIGYKPKDYSHKCMIINRFAYLIKDKPTQRISILPQQTLYVEVFQQRSHVTVFKLSNKSIQCCYKNGEQILYCNNRQVVINGKCNDVQKKAVETVKILCKEL